MKRITLNIDDLFSIPSAVLYNPDDIKPVKQVTINSKNVKPGSLFIAIKGKRFDGHDFVKEAVKNGAEIVLINKKFYNRYDKINVPIVTVNNTVKALGDAARIWRRKLSAKVIGITGSSGKTTLKDMLAKMLSEKYNVNKTELNNNNHIGVPLTILNTKAADDVLVAEVGTNHPGEIAYSASILQPDLAVITNIGSSHLKYLKSKKSIWKEKSSLFEETLKNKGKVFINFDDPVIKKYYRYNRNYISFGFEGRPKVKGRILHYTDDGLPVIQIKGNSKQFECRLNLFGEVSAKNFLAAASIAMELGLSKKHITEAAGKLKNSPHRLDISRFENFILIDDSYNANPDSVKAAIELTGKIKTFKRKVIILGDMLELGEKEIHLHKSLSTAVIKNNVDELYTIGKRMKYLNTATKNRISKADHFYTRKSLHNFIGNYDFSNSIVLIKGSRRLKMEEFANEIKKKASG